MFKTINEAKKPIIESLSCVRLCSNKLRFLLILIVGNSSEIEAQLLAPFHTIIIKSQNFLITQRKIEWICQ